MKKATLRALKQSIAHWERLRDGTQAEGEELFHDDCALCQRFYGCWRFYGEKADGTYSKEKCPVYAQSGRPSCSHTPYYVARGHYYNFGSHSRQFQEAAAAEVVYLKSLLPEEEEK